jgi:hydrogenase nickel incorporation protein HypB
VDLCEANARRVNPSVEVLRVSARTGEGMDAWLAWLERRAEAARPAAGAARDEARP